MIGRSEIGLLAGLLIAVAAVAGGFTGFLLALVLGAVGLGAGAALDGNLDLGRLTGRTPTSGRLGGRGDS